MPKSSAANDLEAFLNQQATPVLVNVLLELADDHAAVHQRLARMQLTSSPVRLAASFKKTLTAMSRSTRFYSYRESREFARELEIWLDQVARELVPADPLAAATLFETFIANEASWFERADDSDGCIGDAMSSACRHWLQAAARGDTPPQVLSQQLVELAWGSEYGAREELWRRADFLLSPTELHNLILRLQEELGAANAAAATSLKTRELRGAIALLSEISRDSGAWTRDRRKPARQTAALAGKSQTTSQPQSAEKNRV